MSQVSLPHDAKAGPTKPELRAVLLDKLALGPEDHFVEVGSCTGAVTGGRRLGWRSNSQCTDRRANRGPDRSAGGRVGTRFRPGAFYEFRQ